MANRGWDQTAGGESVPSNARTTGRTSAGGDAKQWCGSSIAHPSGGDNDPLDKPSDMYEAPGQLSIPAGRSARY